MFSESLLIKDENFKKYIECAGSFIGISKTYVPNLGNVEVYKQLYALYIVGSIGMFGVSSMAFSNMIGIGTLIFIIIYTASFMMSWGPICWVLISEIFPNKIRGRAVAIAVAVQWAANYFISSTYPTMMEYSGGLTYGFYGLMSVLSALFVWKLVPETKGKTLEQMENTWRKRKEDQKDSQII